MSDQATPSVPLTDEQFDDYAYLDLAGLMSADAAAVVGRMRDVLVDEIRRLQAELDETQHCKAERDAFRDQRNAVFATNERLLAEAQESDQAKLRAENETRTMKRELATVRAERDALQKRLLDAAMTRTWRNEDGKKFVFVEDIAPALLGIKSEGGDPR